MKKIAFLSLALFSFNAYADDISTTKLMMRGVDKITGHVATMQATVGVPLEYGSLTIVPEKCMTKPPEEMPENAAFFNVFETSPIDKTKKQIFNGWMFSSNPALSALEHPRYDIWLLHCINEDIAAKVVQPDLIAPQADLNLVAEDDNPALAEDEGNEN